jgi:uncharacterized small protein (DUF1192 family)
MENNQNLSHIINSMLEDVNVNSQTKSILNIINMQSVQTGELKSEIDGLKSKIDELIATGKKKEEEKENGKKPFCKKNDKHTCLLLKIVGFSFLFFVFAILLRNQFAFELSDDSIALTFVGVLATFVVISNYMQVKEAKNEFEKQTTIIKAEFEKQIGAVKTELEVINTELKKKVNAYLKIDPDKIILDNQGTSKSFKILTNINSDEIKIE